MKFLQEESRISCEWPGDQRHYVSNDDFLTILREVDAAEVPGTARIAQKTKMKAYKVFLVFRWLVNIGAVVRSGKTNYVKRGGFRESASAAFLACEEGDLSKKVVNKLFPPGGRP